MPLVTSTKLQPIGRFYLIESPYQDGSYIAESGTLPRGVNWTPAQGLSALQEDSDALAIFECNPAEGSMRDVSEDMARDWLMEFDGDRDHVPAFIEAHIGSDDLDAHFDDLADQRRYERALASPEYVGRL